MGAILEAVAASAKAWAAAILVGVLDLATAWFDPSRAGLFEPHGVTASEIGLTIARAALTWLAVWGVPNLVPPDPRSLHRPNDAFWRLVMGLDRPDPPPS